MMQSVKDAVFGNVGSILSFRTSADDARSMLKYFEPKFVEYDLVHMHNRHFVISMTIEGEKVPAFSAFSLNLPPITEDNSEVIIQQSRANYAINRGHVEDFMQERYITSQKQPTPQPIVPSVDPNISVPHMPEDLRPKRKRTRRRKKKSDTPANQPQQEQQGPALQQHNHNSDETTIHLR
jgi:hypothetical protein